MKQFIKGEFDAQDKLNENFEEINASLSEKSKNIATNAANIAKLSNSNLLINGDFPIWQRGTAFTNGCEYTADRWRVHYHNSTSFNISKSTDVPTGIGANNSMKITITNAGSSNLGGFILRQYIEGNNLYETQLTLSFWIKGVKGAQFSVSLSDIGSKVYTLSGDWEKISSTITVPKISYYLFSDIFRFDLANGLNVLTGDYYITGIKLEIGSIATPFVPRIYAEELALCQRYFERIGTSQSALLGNVGYAPAGTIKLRTVLVYERKRTFPTIKFSDLSQYRVYYDNTGSAGTTASLVTALNASDIHNDILTLSIVPTAPYGTSAYFQLQRIDGATSAWIDIDSEIY